MLRAIVWDLDGLIVDTERTSLMAWEEAYAAHGLVLPIDKWRTIVGTWDAPFDPCLDLGDKRGRALTDAEEARLREREWELGQALPLMPGVLQHLDAAEELGLRLGVASSSTRRWVVGHLERLGIAGRFEVVCTRDDVAATKPDPALYLRALDALGVAGEEALAYEDSYNGLLAAKAAGLRCAVVPGELTAHADFSAADVVISSLAEVDARELWGRF